MTNNLHSRLTDISGPSKKVKDDRPTKFGLTQVLNIVLNGRSLCIEMDSKEAFEDYTLNQGEVKVPLGCDSKATPSSTHVQPLSTKIWETGINNPVVVLELTEYLQTWSSIWLRPH